MYSFSYLEPVCCSMSSSNCCFLACIQIYQEAGQVVWYPQLLKNFPQFVVIHTVKVFGVVNKAEVDVFLEHSCFFDDPEDVGNLISGSSAFSKSSLNIWEFTVHIPLKPGLQNFEHYFASVWNECNCAVVWTFFGIAFLWDWNENWPFPILWPWLSFPNLLAYWVQYFDNSNNLATWCKELTHRKRPWWCLERLKAGGEGDDRGGDGWMSSPTQWTWVWVNSGSWWWTGRPGVLWSMGLQRVGHDCVTGLNWMDFDNIIF